MTIDPPPGTIIVMNDVTACGFCAAGTRRWFEAYSLDFRDFLKNGIDAAKFLATGDAAAQRVVARKLGLSVDG